MPAADSETYFLNYLKECNLYNATSWSNLTSKGWPTMNRRPLKQAAASRWALLLANAFANVFSRRYRTASTVAGIATTTVRVPDIRLK